MWVGSSSILGLLSLSPCEASLHRSDSNGPWLVLELESHHFGNQQPLIVHLGLYLRGATTAHYMQH